MFISSLPKIFPRFISFPLPVLLPNPRWLSKTAPKVPAVTQNLKDCVRIFFDARKKQKYAGCSFALVSALKSCSSSLASFQGRQVHCLVLKSGLQPHILIRNSLINMYAKCGFVDDARLLFEVCFELDPVSCNIMVAGYMKAGRLDDARLLFGKMPGKGCVSYTAMIMGLVQHGCWKEAIEVFLDMRSNDVIPNELTMVNVISAFSHRSEIWSCRMLHALVTKLNIEELVRVSTNLMHAYCLCSGLEEARRLFDRMPERNLVSWNVMLKGYSKAGLVDAAKELFEKFPSKDVISWGTMIDGYVRKESLCEAFMTYCAMLRTGLQPNEVMLVDLVSACGRLMAIGEGQQLHSTIVKIGFVSCDFIQTTIICFYAACGMMNLAYLQFEVGVKDHLESWNALIAGFVKHGMIDQARRIFDEMPERDVYSWSTMISGYSQTDQPNVALELFHAMVSSGIKPNEITMVSVLSAIATLGVLKEGRWFHEYIYNNSILLNDNLWAALIYMYSKCGSINTALQLFNQIQDKTSTVSPWNAIFCGLATHGHANICLEIFSDLQRYHVRPNSITFIGVLSACCHAGLVESGRRIFQSMKSVYGLEPNIKHYGCMIDLLGRAGQLEEAEELVRSMPMKADIVIWGTLLAACRTHGNVEIGEMAARSLAALEPSHGGSKVLLSNIYADAGRWEDVSMVRKVMQTQKTNRMPGCSGFVRR
ncbi:pentatricopeptide repeat-containing protein At5g19020, mitochondrial [Neltuma alba]|uniref:pentatricopeptide repeat-containing protein At5g19020, mitochondrial n=1 Tax=Neltuma alba TaxID=207710 RepID=UPI0010A3A134|nr:pentatricopeptide repeat-containing protein At5g19020, mitochondrial [Prosopis alba]